MISPGSATAHLLAPACTAGCGPLRLQPRRLLAQGWLDTVRARHGDERIYTFWDHFRDHWKRNAGLRIDHLLLNASLAPALIDAGVHTWVRDRPHPSDHAPTWISLDLGAPKAARPTGSKRRSSST